MNLDWIAGFFDGEGSASVALARHRSTVYGYKIAPRIRMTQKTPGILCKIRDTLGMGNVRFQNKCWHWGIQRRGDCLRFVELFAPLSHLKSKQLRLLKETLDITDDGRQGGIGVYLPKNRMLQALELIEKIRNLNGNKRVRNDISVVRKTVSSFDALAYRARSEAVLARTTLNLLKEKSPEHRRKIGEAIRRFRANPEVKARYSQMMKSARNPQFGKSPTQKQLEGLKVGWQRNRGRGLTARHG